MEQQCGAFVLPDERVFIDYGPVSMTISVLHAGKMNSALALEAFPLIKSLLAELGRVLPEVKKYPSELKREKLSGVARLMADAVVATSDPYLTPMAAVAGSISQLVVEDLKRKGAEKVVVNNGGDIALFLQADEKLTIGVVDDISALSIGHRVCLSSEMKIGGVCTSGLGGRSFTTGIASAVTVFSEHCSDADALATLLAGRSLIVSDKVHTIIAAELDPDSDIADQEVVIGLDVLTEEEKSMSLRQIMRESKVQYERGGLRAVLATVQGTNAVFDPECLFR